MIFKGFKSGSQILQDYPFSGMISLFSLLMSAHSVTYWQTSKNVKKAFLIFFGTSNLYIYQFLNPSTDLCLGKNFDAKLPFKPE